jgi:putative transcriptional regulator
MWIASSSPSTWAFFRRNAPAAGGRPDILGAMSNHPNRSKRTPSAARNPRPEEIRAARDAVGITQTEAGALIYCELRTWQDWEGGQRRMHPAFWELWQLKAAKLPARK